MSPYSPNFIRKFNQKVSERTIKLGGRDLLIIQLISTNFQKKNKKSSIYPFFLLKEKKGKSLFRAWLIIYIYIYAGGCVRV